MTKLVLLLAAGVFLAQPAFAQQDQPEKIDLRKAIELALENNLNIQQAENLLDREATNVNTSYAAFLPNLTSNVNWNRNTGFQFNPASLSIEESTVYSTSGSLNTSITLFSGLRNIYTLRASKASYMAQEQRLKRAREVVIFNTAAAYLQVLLDTKLLEIAKQNLESQQKQLDQIVAQVQVGARPQIDQFNQESIVASTELQLIQRENAINLDRIRLLRQLQIDPLKAYEFDVPTVADAKVVVASAPNLAEMIDRAYANRTDLKSLESGIDASRYNLKFARGSYAPSITLNGSLSSSYNNLRTDAITREKLSFGDQFFDQNINRGMGINVNFPIFTRWQRANNVSLNKVSLKNAELDFENQRLQVMQEVQQAYNDFINFSKQVESTRKAYTAAERALLTEQERYKVGASTLIELTRANASFVEASANKTNATYNYIFQELLLNYFLGMISSDVSLDKYK